MIRTAILTVSDSAVAGTREDRSGPLLKEQISELGWTVTASAVVADDIPAIADQILRWADEETASLIVTTGGTGIAPRDNTPEATRSVLQRELPGVAELMRTKGLEQTPLAVLSRGLVGTRGRTLIVNLPGTPRGAVHSFGAITHLIPHIVDLLEGRTAHS